MAKFLANVSPDIPWHCTAFHPDYKMHDRGATPVRRWCEQARSGGRRACGTFMRATLPGQIGGGENTYCPKCHELLIERYGFQVRKYRLTARRQMPEVFGRNSRPLGCRQDARGIKVT